MKKLFNFGFLLVTTLVLCLLLSPAAEAATVDSGTCGAEGDNLTWTLDDQGTLTISGQGRMYDWYDYTGSRPGWYTYRDTIGKVVITEGVTHIGYNAFYNCTALAEIQIPETVTSIEAGAFYQSAIKEIQLPQSITELSGALFAFCPNLESIVIPDSVETIASNVFLGCTGLKEVTIGKGVTVMGTQAFKDCTALERIYYNAVAVRDMNYGNDTFRNAGTEAAGITLTVGKDVTKIPVYFMSPNFSTSGAPNLKTVRFEEGSVCASIGNFAFAYCDRLTDITMPAGLKTIGSSAFISCTGLTEVTIPDSVTTLYYYAFYGCTNLKKLTIGKSVQSGLADAFEDCDKLCTIQVAGENPYFSADAYGVLFNKNKTVLIKCLPQLSGTYTIPNTVKEIGENAFLNRDQLTEIIMQEGVTKIADSAFLGCFALEKIAIPETVLTIGSRAFSSCWHLTAISLPDSVQTLGEGVFDQCEALRTVYLGKGVTGIGNEPFGFTGVWDGIYVHEDNTAYCSVDGVLYSKDMKTIIQCPKNKAGAYTIPEGVVTVEDFCFNRCMKLTAITLPESLQYIGMNSFSRCINVTAFDLPQGLKEIGYAAFYGCNGITGFVIPDGVETINASLLDSCENLRYVIIGNGVKEIMLYMVLDCTNLEKIVFTGNIPQIDSNAFAGAPLTATAYYPSDDSTWTAEKLQEYYGGWVTWKPYVTGKSGSCGEGVSFELDDDGTLTIYTEAVTRNVAQGTMTSAPWNVLYKDELKAVVIEEGVLNVVAGAFEGCGNLETVTVAKTVADIGSNAFASCAQLQAVTFRGSAPTMDSTAFSGSDTTIYYPADDETWNDELKATIGNTFVPVDDTTEKFDIDVARMILGNSLDFQFGVAVDKLPDTTGCYAVINKLYADGTATSRIIPAAAWSTAGPYWAIVYDGLAAKEMADTFYVTIYNADGQAISNAKTDSVRAYVARVFDSQTAEGKTMMVDMLNYGAAAQTKFNYNTEDLANSQLTEAQKACGTATLTATQNIQTKGPNYVGTRLVLESRIQMQVAFSGMDRTMYAVYSYTDHNGTQKNVTVKGEDFIEASGMYGIELSELVYADARTLVTVRVYNADGTLYSGAKDSIQSYVNRSGETDTLFTALMKFTDSAKAYLH